MGSFIVSSLINLVSMDGGVSTGYAIQGLMNGFSAFKTAYNTEDIRQDRAKFARDAAMKEAKIRANEQELIDSKNAVHSAEFYLNASLKNFDR